VLAQRWKAELVQPVVELIDGSYEIGSTCNQSAVCYMQFANMCPLIAWMAEDAKGTARGRTANIPTWGLFSMLLYPSKRAMQGTCRILGLR
jgi:hypothetical protein